MDPPTNTTQRISNGYVWLLGRRRNPATERNQVWEQSRSIGKKAVYGKEYYIKICRKYSGGHPQLAGMAGAPPRNGAHILAWGRGRTAPGAWPGGGPDCFHHPYDWTKNPMANEPTRSNSPFPTEETGYKPPVDISILGRLPVMDKLILATAALPIKAGGEWRERSQLRLTELVRRLPWRTGLGRLQAWAHH